MVLIHTKYSYFCISGCEKGAYHFWTQLCVKNTFYGGDEQRMELLTETLEMAEGQDHYLFRMGIQPCLDFFQHSLS